MIKFLQESTDTPHAKGVTKEHLSLPNPGIDEYRRYYYEQEVTQTHYETDEQGDYIKKTERVNTAQFVACACDHEPTDEEWSTLLQQKGYSEEAIKVILGNA